MTVTRFYGTRWDYERIVREFDPQVQEVVVLAVTPGPGDVTVRVSYPRRLRKVKHERAAGLQLLIDCGDPFLAMVPIGGRCYVEAM